MRHFLLASASLIALTPAAIAAPTTAFNFVGNIVNFTVTNTGTYQITASGAQGGFDNAGNGAPISVGAEIGGTFSLNSGDVLQIAVGGAGGAGAWAGGGGGGTFVIDYTTGLALIIAGGGGGGWYGTYAGGNGLTSTGGSGSGGVSGVGGGGGGLTGDGGSALHAGGGRGFANSLLGGFGTNGGTGGFGGGGGGGPNADGGSGGGGGGGYTGGAGGFYSGGGGGGSFNGGTSQLAALGGASFGGNGHAAITETSSVPVPEPISGALLSVGVVGIGFVRRYLGRLRGRLTRMVPSPSAARSASV